VEMEKSVKGILGTLQRLRLKKGGLDKEVWLAESLE
jgi:hypothetical protein